MKTTFENLAACQVRINNIKIMAVKAAIVELAELLAGLGALGAPAEAAMLKRELDELTTELHELTTELHDLISDQMLESIKL